MTINATKIPPLRWLLVLLLSLLWAMMGSAASLAERDFFGCSSLAAKTTEGTTGYRYVTEAEIQAIKNSGMLRSGRPGETFFTKDVYKSGAHAQERLSLPTTPTHRIEFNVTNNPTMLRNGTKVDPVGSLPGKGSEFMSTDPVRVDLINVQPLR
jgi:hypothetical protein